MLFYNLSHWKQIPKGKMMKRNYLKPASGLMLAALLAACGGGSSPDNGSAPTSLAANAAPLQAAVPTGTQAEAGTPAAVVTAPSADEDAKPMAKTVPTGTAATTVVTPSAASRFLAQATFGPTATSINALVASNKSDWINAQFAKPQALHRSYVEQIGATLAAGTSVSPSQVYESFWSQAVTGDDQLRQRMKFALSQIFVISMVDDQLASSPAGVASYYDMLGQYAFGNYRDLLQAVALHPMMGVYLSHMHNQKESGNRVPDENFAREIMQLMSIGLYQLNADGSLKLSNGKPIETYTHDDVVGLARVFTGWSWAGPDKSDKRFMGGTPYAARTWTPMQMYPTYHSTMPKNFLGVSTSGTGEADLKVALDTLFNHPNVGPFIGRQLIQRLVTSNPSPAYVARVAAAFANNGAGVRGDLRAVIRAVLLDSEAGDANTVKKLREPVVRLANWMRAFNAKSKTGRFLLGITDDPITSLGQTALRSPSVFNFYRPSYTPTNTALSAAGMVAPEMQITGEPSVTGYLNYMQRTIQFGTGSASDIQADYSVELSLTSQPAQLVDRVSLLLLGGSMSSTLRNQILSALNAISVPSPNAYNAMAIDTGRKNRVYMAIYLTMASPEYLAQR
jgi:uncharacterized protein (DUF1800 family)